jgi:hypothetical protein
MGEKYNIEATLLAHDYGQGLKLMEHSYIGNTLTDVVAALITVEPKRLVWLGDYGEFADCKNKNITEQQFNKVRHQIWKKRTAPLLKGIKTIDGLMTKGFLLNYTKMEYIDLAAYCHKVRGWDYMINPLPLLTAVGNGKGGGDYWRKNTTSYNKVGTWAFDVIQYWPEATKETLKGFKQIRFAFTEGEPDRPHEYEETTND